LDISIEKIERYYRHLQYRLKFYQNWVPSGRLKDTHIREDAKILFFKINDDHLKEIYYRYLNRNYNNDLEFAEDVLEHKFSFLKHTVKHGKEIQWDLDPVSGVRWKDVFFRDIVYRGQKRLGDIKLPWELNKHQYFFILGKMYWLTGRDEFRREITDEIDSWIQKNKLYGGINWISALEIGSRVISWAFAYPFISESLDCNLKSRIVRCLYSQCKFIEENLSIGKYANTHKVGEAAALIIGGIFINSPKSDVWIKKGISVLYEEIKKQVFSDGVHKEQSLNYHRFFLDYYYLSIILLRRNKLVYPPIIDEFVERMTEFVLYAIKPDATAPSFGDEDDARAIFLYNNCTKDYIGVLSLGAALFKRGDFKYVADELTEEVFWLLGEDGVAVYSNLEKVLPKNTSAAYKEAGYFIMRSGWEKDAQYLIFDCGPLGYGQAGHGHADSLSFQLFCDGADLLIDPGTYSYNLDYGWRNYFRSTAAHNTVTIDGKDQSEMLDRMSWVTVASSTCNFWLTTDLFDIVEGEHNGYYTKHNPVRHKRAILSNKSDYWIIVDLFESNGKHVYAKYLHLAPDIFTEIVSGEIKIENKKNNLNVKYIEIIEPRDSNQKIELFNGDLLTKSGWFSPAYGYKTPCTTIRVSKIASGNTSFITVIKKPNLELKVKAIPIAFGANAFFITNLNDMSKDLFAYGFSTIGQLEIKKCSFYGKILYVREDKNQVKYIYAKEFQKFEWNNLLSVQSSQIILEMTLSNGSCDIKTENVNIDIKADKKRIYRIVVNNQVYNEIQNI
jgi:hypothetical protein